MSSDLNLVMTVVGFSFSALFMLFVCTRLICARIHSRASRRSRARASASDPSTMERGGGLHGIDPLVVANFPTLTYREFRVSSPEISQCIICLSEYEEEEETLRVLPICGHGFHKSCIDKWLQQNSTCPVCRLSVRVNPEGRRCTMQHLFSSAVRSQCVIITHSNDHRGCPSSNNDSPYNHQRGTPNNNRVQEDQVTRRPEANCVTGDCDWMIHKDGVDGKSG